MWNLCRDLPEGSLTVNSMFDHETWRHEIAERFNGFARDPRQELQLAGAPSLLSYLVSRTLDPFLEAFQHEPIAAVIALAEISREPGADQLVRHAARMRYQSAAQADRELRASKTTRIVIEQLLTELQTVSLVRQRLNASREEWMRAMLERELDLFPGEFVQLKRVLNDPGWQNRYEALRKLRSRNGHYTAADLVLIHDGLSDGAVHVRTTAARMLGLIAERPPVQLLKALVRVALHDCDAETRCAAARAVGALREHVTSLQMLDQLSASLFDEDRFVRSSAALVLGQLGEMASAPALIANLMSLLVDTDAYAREAAARALGQIGIAAATPDVIAALERADQEGDIHVHEAAVDSLARLRELRHEFPLQREAGG